MPKLKIAGLGLSELKQDNYENANAQQDYTQSSQQQNSEVNEQQEINKNKAQIPKLQIAGLGLTELTKDNKEGREQTHKQLDNEQQTNVDDSNQQYKDNNENQQQDQQNQVAKSSKVPALKLGGLGLSILQKDETKEEFKQEQPSKPASKIPKLNIGGLGLSTVTQEQSNKNQEEKDAEQVVRNQQKEEQEETSQQQQDKKINIPKLKINGLGPSDLVKDATQVQEQSQKQEQPAQPKIPSLKLGGLGLSNLVPDNKNENQQPQIQNQEEQEQENKLQEKNELHKTMDDAKEEELFKKQGNNFDKTAPLKQHLEEDSKLNFNKESKEKQSKDMLISSESAQFMNHVKSTNSIYIPQEQIDERKKEKLKLSRKNLIPPRNRLASSNSEADTFKELRNEAENDQNLKRQIHNYSEQKNQLLSQGTDEKNYNINFPNSNYTPGDSARSNGSYVGKNKVFVPFLKFPNDIHQDPSEKVTRYEKPDDARFKLLKTKDNAGITPEKNQGNAFFSNQKPKGKGKKGKLLDIRPSQEDMDTQLKEQQEDSNQDTEENKNTEINQPTIPKLNIINSEEQDEKRKQEQQLEKQEQQEQQQPQKIEIPKLKIPIKSEVVDKNRDQEQKQVEEENQENEPIGKLTELQMQLSSQNSKFQLIQEKRSKKNLDQIKINENQCKKLYNEIFITEETFYQKERAARPIYQDEELQVMMISLMMCLLLKPQRGTLDDLYCSQYPIDNEKQNVLFLLQIHLNHSKNQRIQTHLMRQVSTIKPYLAGQRLMKLLSTSLFDIGIYNNGKDWKKIDEGAYAQVYEAPTNITEPQYVAIKEMKVPQSIYDRCVLHDIFTEISCLEEFRLEPCVTDLYDYGVQGSSYYIVMKRYTCSLRKWRMSQTKSLNENLSLYLSIYKEVLKAMKTIHSHNVSHYDMKCDNVLLDFGPNVTNMSEIDEDQMRTTIGDFGECKIFLNEKDEYCMRNRGTDYCKSPEMLQLAINTRKDTDKYDRRKQMGTSRLSDVWSMGCLFYELLTGDFLFYTQDYCEFLFRVTKQSEALFTDEKLQKINQNVYLVDFLKYMLVRDQRLRPTLDSVLKRFEHVHALLVSTSSANSRFNIMQQELPSVRGQISYESLLEQIQQIMLQNSQVFGGEIAEEALVQNETEGQNNQSTLMQQEEEEIHKQQNEVNEVIDKHQIMKDVFLSSENWIKNNQFEAIKLGITHIIMQENQIDPTLRDKFYVLEFKEIIENSQFQQPTMNQMNPFILMPAAMDFLRIVSLQNGKVLFVECCNNNQNHHDLIKQNKNYLLRESMLLCLSQIFQTSAYEKYTLIKSQNLSFQLKSTRLTTISKWTMLNYKIKQQMNTYPQFQCQCGSCMIFLKRQLANYSNLSLIKCNCCQYYKNIETSQCPSPGCNEFIQFMKTYFKKQYDSLNWGFVDEEDFVLGPNYLSQNNVIHRQITSNMSQTIDRNTSIVSMIEKSIGYQGKDILSQDYNLISKSSATAKNNYYGGYARWKLFKCKECHVWTHAINEVENRYAILLNNRSQLTQNNAGLLNAKQDETDTSGVKVPYLKNFKLNIPF